FTCHGPVMNACRPLFVILLAAIAILASCRDDNGEGLTDADSAGGDMDTADGGDLDASDVTTDTDTRDTAYADSSTSDVPTWDVTVFDVPPENCDPSLRPIVFVHGFLASGDTVANHAMRFAANGH